MRDKGQSLPGKRFTSLPLTMASIHAFPTMLRCCVVKHLRRRFKPPKEMKNKISRSSTATRKGYWIMNERQPVCLRHIPFTGLPQTLEVLPCFPALLWCCCGGLLCWEVRAVVTRRRRLGSGGRGRGNRRLWKS